MSFIWPYIECESLSDPIYHPLFPTILCQLFWFSSLNLCCHAFLNRYLIDQCINLAHFNITHPRVLGMFGKEYLVVIWIDPKSTLNCLT